MLGTGLFYQPQQSQQRLVGGLWLSHVVAPSISPSRRCCEATTKQHLHLVSCGAHYTQRTRENVRPMRLSETYCTNEATRSVHTAQSWLVRAMCDMTATSRCITFNSSTTRGLTAKRRPLAVFRPEWTLHTKDHTGMC